MRLWIDGQCFQTPSMLRGIGRYMIELIRAIAEYCPTVQMSISFNAGMTDEAIAARITVAPWIKPHDIHVWQGCVESPEAVVGHTDQHRLSEIALLHHVRCLDPDVALSASPFEGQYDLSVPFLPPDDFGIPCAGLFYDAIPHRFPAHYLSNPKVATAYKRRMAAHRHFDLLLAISDFARREAQDIVPGVEAVNIAAGISPDFAALTRVAADPAILTRLRIHRPFLLYVGGMDWRKNVPAVIEAIALLPARETLQFVVAGDVPESAFAKLRGLWEQKKLPDGNLVGLGHVSDETLVQLYKQTDLVIQPSLMEGFGLTALEAMSLGAPVIASRTGALPEVVGDPRALFDPSRPKRIAERIGAMLSDRTLTQTLVGQGIAQARDFTWERSARTAVAALQGLTRRARDHTPVLASLRQRAQAALGVPDDPARAAQLLAAAEPRSGKAEKRLLIDVSYISNMDHGTGIQRVVKSIAVAALARPPSERRALPVPCACHSLRGFFPAQMTVKGDIRAGSVNPRAQILPGPADHMLMLDSSWEAPVLYSQVLRRFRVQGADVTSVLYDLVPLKFPAFCSPEMPGIFGAWLKSALTYSTGFVCISQAVADELLALLAAIDFPRAMKVGYWHLGADLPPSATVEVASSQNAAPIFLMVGTLEPRKGHRVALDAFTQLWKRGFEGHLHIIGRRGWGVDHLIAGLQSHPEFGKKLHWQAGAGDAVLNAHYRACTALIAASYAEGFGLPIVEAAYRGKPVIASDIPVFREVAEGRADVSYFASGSSEALATAVMEFAARPHPAMPPSQDKSLTWAQSAAELENVVLGGNWYRIHQPRRRHCNVSLDAIGDLAVKPASGAYRLELVEGPIAAPKGHDLKFVFRVTNQSMESWAGGADGVALGFRLYDGKGQPLNKDIRRAEIPLVHLPGDTHYMAAHLTGRWKNRDVRGVEFALMQGDQFWAERGVRVSLRG